MAKANISEEKLFAPFKQIDEHDVPYGKLADDLCELIHMGITPKAEKLAQLRQAAGDDMNYLKGDIYLSLRVLLERERKLTSTLMETITKLEALQRNDKK